MPAEIQRVGAVVEPDDQDFDRDSNTIEVFVGRLRKKIGVNVIKIIRGQGYRLEPPADDPA